MQLLNHRADILLGVVGLAIVVYALVGIWPGIVRRRLVIPGQRDTSIGREAVRNGVFWVVFGLAFVVAAVFYKVTLSSHASE
jgi:hypothetical protein